MCKINGHAFPEFTVPSPDTIVNRNWGRGFTYFLVDGVPVVTGIQAQMQGSPMMYVPSSGIYFDGDMCDRIAQTYGGHAVFFILCHEMAHHALGHRHGTNANGEMDADRIATLLILMQYPHHALRSFTAIHNYFTANGSSGGWSHPSDRERANSVQVAWEGAQQQECFVRIINDDRISEEQATRALGILGVSAQSEVQRLLKQAKSDGAITLGRFSFSDAAKRVQQLEVYEKVAGIAFTGTFIWKNMEPCRPPSGGSGGSAGMGSASTGSAILGF
jgi:hypothetical protein